MGAVRCILPALLVVLLIACSSGPQDLVTTEDLLPELAWDKFGTGIRDRVRVAYEQVRVAPHNAAKNGELAMLLQAHDEFVNAEAFYRRARRLDPTAMRWSYYLGIVQQRRAKHEEAAENFRDALKLEPDYAPARLRLADSLLALDKFDESGELYQAVIDEHPGIAEAHYGLGRVLAAKGDTMGSVRLLLRACELGPSFGPAHYALALAYRDLGNAGKAKEHLALYEKDRYGGPVTPDPLLANVKALKTGANVHIRRGVDLEKAGRIAEAIAEHERAVELDPSIVQTRVNLVILYGRMGNFEKAYEHYLAALETGAPHAELHYNFGVMAFEKERNKEAQAAFEQALKLNPQYAAAHNNLGYLLQAQGRREEAMRHYRLAIENDPNHRLALFHLGRLLAQQGRAQEAIAAFEKIIEPVDDQTPQFLYALAAAHDLAGHHQQAFEYAHRAQQLAIERGQPQLAAKIEQGLKKLAR
jgi:tetratricopeptide (TPR) repeat protein